MVHKTDIRRVTAFGSEPMSELLAIEEPLEIRLGFGNLDDRQQKSLSVTMRTPGHDFELALGFLFTEGIIASFNQIESIKYCEDTGRPMERDNVVRVELKSDTQLDFKKLQRNFYTSSSCGVCGKSSIDAVWVSHVKYTDTFSIHGSIIHLLPSTLRNAQTVFEHTGGLHAAGLFDGRGALTLLREDVGRHNALDKVIGAMLFDNMIQLSQTILLVSGRASFELVQKAAVAGIPILSAVGAPSSLAVDLAKSSGITLVGFIRENRFNIYSNPQRIRTD